MTRKSYYHFVILFIVLTSCSKDTEPETNEIPDTLAPKIAFTIKGMDLNINEPIVVSGQLEITIDAEDSGGISRVEAFINDEKVGEDTTVPYNIIIDLNSFQSKSGKNSYNLNEVLRLTATDKAGNRSSAEQAIIITANTPLITITFPEGFISSFFENITVFASYMDGKLLEGTTTPISSSTRSVTLYAPNGFNLEDEFMVTFMTFNSGYETSFSYGTTFQNLTIDNPKEINLKFPDRLGVIENKTFPTNGIDINTITSGDGADYRTSIHYDENQWSLQTLEPVNQPEKITDKVFLWNFLEGDFTNYNYIFIPRPVPENFELNLSDFVNENSSSGTIMINNVQQVPELHSRLALMGYETEMDFESDTYHEVWNMGLGNFTFPIIYGYYNGFHKYRYHLTFQNFHVEGEGLPLDSYSLPNWTLNPVVNNNIITLNKSGTGNEVGRVILREDSPAWVYEWKIIFDSGRNENVIIPQLPEIYANTPLNENLETNSLSIYQLELSHFENIPDYDAYLSEVIRENRDSREVSEYKEVIFYSLYPVYVEFKDLFFD